MAERLRAAAAPLLSNAAWPNALSADASFRCLGNMEKVTEGTSKAEFSVASLKG